MQKCVEAAKVISRELSKDHSFYLEDLGLDKTFEGIYKLGVPSKDENRIICFIVFAYDPDSQKLDIRKDRTDNKLSILHGLGADTNSDLFKEIIVLHFAQPIILALPCAILYQKRMHQKE